MVLLRHLLAIAILPFGVAVAVPLWIGRRFGVQPALERRFGAAYVEYRRNVPRVRPRLRPWSAPP